MRRLIVISVYSAACCVVVLSGPAFAYEPRNLIGYHLAYSKGSGDGLFDDEFLSRQIYLASLYAFPKIWSGGGWGPNKDNSLCYGLEWGRLASRFAGFGFKLDRFSGEGRWRSVYVYGFGNSLFADWRSNSAFSALLCTSWLQVRKMSGFHLRGILGVGPVLGSVEFREKFNYEGSIYAPASHEYTAKLKGMGYAVELGGEVDINLGQLVANQWLILYLQVVQRFMEVPKMKLGGAVDTNGDGIIDLKKGDEFPILSGDTAHLSQKQLAARFGVRFAY